VTAFEHMKLRMLNGTHSSLAYLGYLAGHETIADTVADPAFAAYVRRLWATEIIPALAAPPGVDLGAYAGQLFDRYANPAIRHRTWQIAMDGSQKLPQRILGTLAANLEAGRNSPGLILAVAAWMVYVRGTDLAGQPIDVRDPMADALRAAATAPDPVAALLAMRGVFPEALAARLEAPLRTAHAALLENGVSGALAAL
jgi:fructuronate reductase